MEVYANECTKNQVCKLFALADRAFTQDMSAMPLEKLKKILSNYWVSYDIKYYLKYIWSNNIAKLNIYKHTETIEYVKK